MLCAQLGNHGLACHSHQQAALLQLKVEQKGKLIRSPGTVWLCGGTALALATDSRPAPPNLCILQNSKDKIPEKSKVELFKSWEEKKKSIFKRHTNHYVGISLKMFLQMLAEAQKLCSLVKPEQSDRDKNPTRSPKQSVFQCQYFVPQL